MCVHDITLDHLAGADTAVVRSLGRGETALRPAVRVVVKIEKGVFLLKTKPWHMVSVRLGELCCLVAGVELVGRAVGVHALAQDEDVVAALGAERIGEDGHRFKEDVGVVAGGLTC